MTALVHKLGLSKKLAFHDVFSIDDEELLAFTPRPSYALLLVFPCTEIYENHRRQEDLDRANYEASGPQEPVMWFQQTIGNACGLIGLLHCVANGDARTFVGEYSIGIPESSAPLSNPLVLIEKGSSLEALLDQALPLQPKDRAQLLMDSDTLEAAHQEAAVQGDSVAPAADSDVDLHYVCFVKGSDGHLYEMDGRRKAPLDRGSLSEAEDALSERALQLGVRSFMEREKAAGDDDVRFSLLTLATNLD